MKRNHVTTSEESLALLIRNSDELLCNFITVDENMDSQHIEDQGVTSSSELALKMATVGPKALTAATLEK